MGLPRSRYVREGQEGVYHCFSRCVRRAFLYGLDPLTGRDFSHRKAWILDRLRCLSTIFAIEVCAYAIMWNHYHVILRIRPDIATCWSDREVAIRWLSLFPQNHRSGNTSTSPTEEDISALLLWPERIAVLRKRLCNLSWFMGRLNEFIARAGNKEDNVKGRFWESRYKCQALLDEAAIATCMVYVDLNPIRAGLAATPEESDFTSIQERIRAWQSQMLAQASVPTPISIDDCQDTVSTALPGTMPGSAIRAAAPRPVLENMSDTDWLCPIASEGQRRGILPMPVAEYFHLVDQSGRLIRSDKRGAIPPDLAPILLRIGVKQEAWLDTVSRFESKFYLAAGLLSHLRHFAAQIGSKWLKGVAVARAAFA
jgi:REP element-mobilizing transposase RayT